MYILLAALGVSPHEGLTTLLICVDQVEPLPTMYAVCSFQFSPWSRITPRYLVLFVGIIMMFGRVSVGLGSLLLWCTRSMSTILPYSKCKLWVLVHSIAPPSLVIMSDSLLCACWKVFAIAVRMASSTYAVMLGLCVALQSAQKEENWVLCCSMNSGSRFNKSLLCRS